MLGDETVTTLGLPGDIDREQREMIEKLFPEAIITYEAPGYRFLSHRSQ
jgi:hypothetical protein